MCGLRGRAHLQHGSRTDDRPGSPPWRFSVQDPLALVALVLWGRTGGGFLFFLAALALRGRAGGGFLFLAALVLRGRTGGGFLSPLAALGRFGRQGGRLLPMGVLVLLVQEDGQHFSLVAWLGPHLHCEPLDGPSDVAFAEHHLAGVVLGCNFLRHRHDPVSVDRDVGEDGVDDAVDGCARWHGLEDLAFQVRAVHPIEHLRARRRGWRGSGQVALAQDSYTEAYKAGEGGLEGLVDGHGGLFKPLQGSLGWNGLGAMVRLTFHCTCPMCTLCPGHVMDVCVSLKSPLKVSK
jgi:hypothetical protein